MTRQTGWIAIGVVGALIVLRSLSAIWSLFNVPSDAAAWCAIALLALVVMASVVLGGFWWRAKPLFGVLLVLVCASLTGCTRIGPGYVGIVVNMAGTSKGVQSYPSRTGWVFYNPLSESVLEYPTFVQTAVWTQNTAEGKPVNEELTFTNSDQMQIAADISLAYQLDPDKVPAFYVMFRSDDIDKFTHGYLRNIAREKIDSVAGRYKIEAIMGDNAPLIAEVRKALQAELTPIGVTLKQFGFIGAPRPPQQVINAINGNNQAMQISRQKQNELAQVQADAAKMIAEADGQAKARIRRAEGEAQANRLLAESLNTNVIAWYTLVHWDGKLPQVSGSGGTIPMIQLAR